MAMGANQEVLIFNWHRGGLALLWRLWLHEEQTSCVFIKTDLGPAKWAGREAEADGYY